MASKAERLADDQFVESITKIPLMDNASLVGASVAEYIDTKVEPVFKNTDAKDLPRYQRGVKKIEVAMGSLIQQEFTNFRDEKKARETAEVNIGRQLPRTGPFDVQCPKTADFIASQVSRNHPQNVASYCSSKTYEGLTELIAL